MSGWLPADAIIMERRHISEGEKRVGRQEALLADLIERRHDELARSADELLALMRKSLELSKARLRALEGGERPGMRLKKAGK
jgi:hypothetical protein